MRDADRISDLEDRVAELENDPRFERLERLEATSAETARQLEETIEALNGWIKILEAADRDVGEIADGLRLLGASSVDDVVSELTSIGLRISG